MGKVFLRIDIEITLSDCRHGFFGCLFDAVVRTFVPLFNLIIYEIANKWLNRF